MSAACAPVLGRPEAVRWVQDERGLGRTIALANGCFDLLHVGHVRYLTAARAEADRLIVGLNDDASVAAAKQVGRPLFSAADRARLVAALRPVDAVTIFSEATADALIRALRPDVHCKGPDYADGVPEAETDARVGARIAIVGGAKRGGSRDRIAEIRSRKT